MNNVQQNDRVVWTTERWERVPCVVVDVSPDRRWVCVQPCDDRESEQVPVECVEVVEER